MADSPNQIDISLALMGEGSQSAIQELVAAVQTNTAALGHIQDSMLGLKSDSFPKAASALGPGSHASTTVPVGKPHISEQGPQAGGGSPPSSGPPGPPDDADTRGRLSRMAMGPKRDPQTGDDQNLWGRVSSGGFGQSVKRALPFSEGQLMYTAGASAVGGVVNPIMGAGGMLMPSSSAEAGQQATGQSKDPGWGSLTKLPFSQYFSPAGQSGLDLRWEEIKRSIRNPIVSMRDYQQAGDITAGLGWGHRQKEQLGMMDTIALANKNTGLEMGTGANITDQFVRYGDHNIKEASAALHGLASAATAANMNVTEFAKQTAEGAKQAEQTGGNFGNAFSGISRWSSNTGLPPATYGQLQGNSFVQANTMAATGLLPWEQGLLTTPNRVGAAQGLQYQTIDQMMGVFSNRGNSSYRDPTTGQKTTISGREKQIADVAHIMGIPTKDLENMMNTRQYATNRSKTQDELDTFSAKYKDSWSGKYQGASGQMSGDWAKIKKDTLGAHYADDTTTQKWFKDIEKKDAGHPEKMAADLRGKITDYQAQDHNPTSQQGQIGLTPEARRWFAIIDPKGQHKKGVNAGNAPDNTNDPATANMPTTPPMRGNQINSS